MSKLSDFLEFSPFDNKVSSEFLREIPNIIIESDGTIDKEKAFWNHFFVEYAILQYQNTIKDFADAVNEDNKHYILFMGPSGSGKTTFLNYLIREKEKYFCKDIQIDMINLIKDPTNADIRSELFHNALDSKIIHYLSKEVVIAISKHFVSYEKREKASWNINWLVGEGSEKYDKHEVFYNFIRKNRNNYSPNAVRQFCHNIDNISDKIALYFISFVMNKCIEGKKPCLFIFDNLDELDQEYLTKSLNMDLLSAFSKAQDFFEKVILNITYPFLSKCTTLESIRRNFYATVNSTQLKERIEKSSLTIKFDSGYEQNAHDIIDKRAKLHFSSNTEEVIKNRQSSYAKKFNISIIDKEEKYIKRLCRLFNLDYRTTFSSLSYALNKDISSWGYNAEQDNDCRLGVRGFLLFNVLKYRLKIPDTRFEKYVKEDLSNNNCNRYRMFFSILAKMYAAIGENGKKKKGELDIFHVSLLDFTDRIKEWYDKITIQSIYDALFVSGYHNYSLPANLEGETINNYIREKKYNVTLLTLCEHLAELYKNDKDSLSNVDIVVNPLCIEYSKHVFIHYEYFNILSVYAENSDLALSDSKSLFQHESLEEIKSCTKRVYDVTDAIVNKADNHLCTFCGNKKCGDNSLDCNQVIMRMQNQGFLMQDNILYATRVITSHINYLDSFRKLLWNTYHKTDNKLNNEMQNWLISVIKKYVELFRNKKVKNESANVVIKTIEQNLDYAQNNGYNVWTPISIGLSSNSDED